MNVTTELSTDPLALDMLGQSVSAHVQESARSLALLKAIDVTISALRLERDLYERFCSNVCDFAINVRHSKNAKPIDPTGKSEKIYSNAQAAAKRLHVILSEKLNAAIADPEVFDSDGLVEEFERTISALVDLHDSLNDVRWAIADHDANNGKVTGEFDSADKLFAYLKK